MNLKEELQKAKNRLVRLTPKMSRDVDTSIGISLRYMRKVLKISQEEMGRLMDVHQAAICRIESGSQRVTAVQYQLMELMKNSVNSYLKSVSMSGDEREIRRIKRIGE